MPLRELDNQGIVCILFFFFLAVTVMIVELDHIVRGWRTHTPHKENDRIT